VPSGATTGSVVVTVSGVQSNGLTFTLTAAVPALGPVAGLLLARWDAGRGVLTASAGARSRREKAKGTSVPTVRSGRNGYFGTGPEQGFPVPRPIPSARADPDVLLWGRGGFQAR